MKEWKRRREARGGDVLVVMVGGVLMGFLVILLVSLDMFSDIFVVFCDVVGCFWSLWWLLEMFSAVCGDFWGCAGCLHVCGGFGRCL